MHTTSQHIRYDGECYTAEQMNEAVSDFAFYASRAGFDATTYEEYCAEGWRMIDSLGDRTAVPALTKLATSYRLA